MRTVIDPGTRRRSINFIDNIVFSHVTDLDGQPLDLRLSLMLQNGNSEMRLADGRDDEVSTGKQPLIVWINGAGWRGCDKNLMSAEMEFLAEAGYAVAFIDYRGSSKGHMPAQIVDCKTAIRFLRAHADQYGIDPERIGVIGRSGGGHLAAFMGLNTDGFDSEEWAGYSSKVKAVVDLFGPVDMEYTTRSDIELCQQPGNRFRSIQETHEGVAFGLTYDMTLEQIMEIARRYSVFSYLHRDYCPIAIFHGDQDPLVPLSNSEDFYDRLAALGLEHQTELYVVKNGGHGTREFFQGETKKHITAFFGKYL